jgi:hypothetical protein
MKLFFKPKAAKTEEVMPTLTLSDLCSEAADHVAKARLSLSDDDNDADRALLHLDDAILCLRRLFDHGRPAVAARAPARSKAS